MPKSDFEFYTVSGVDGEFVRPQPASDPYHGALRIEEVPLRAVNDICCAIKAEVGATPSVRMNTAKPDDMRGYFFTQTFPDIDKVPQRVEASVQLAYSDDYYSNEMNQLSRRFVGSRAIMPVFSSDEVKGPELIREYGGIEDRTWLLDDNDKAVNPTITFRQIIHARAHRWLPGPTRRSGKHDLLPPTHSPRPVSLVFAQLVTVTGLNPYVDSDY